jgi:tagatose 1,6-diphosphate aldolase GatY/KbaY
MTDPQDAIEFAAGTGVDALAVGNVLGLTSRPVSLDLDRPRQSTPPSRYRSSCMAPAGYQQLSDAINCGVAKININTELRHAYLAAMQSALRAVLSILDSHIVPIASHSTGVQLS